MGKNLGQNEAKLRTRRKGDAKASDKEDLSVTAFRICLAGFLLFTGKFPSPPSPQKIKTNK